LANLRIFAVVVDTGYYRQHQNKFGTGLALDHVGLAAHGARELAHEGKPYAGAQRRSVACSVLG
jgi:hypothetical protein